MSTTATDEDLRLDCGSIQSTKDQGGYSTQRYLREVVKALKRSDLVAHAQLDVDTGNVVVRYDKKWTSSQVASVMTQILEFDYGSGFIYETPELEYAVGEIWTYEW